MELILSSLFFILIISSCSVKDNKNNIPNNILNTTKDGTKNNIKNNSKKAISNQPVYLYIYNRQYINNKPIDSLMIFESDYDRTLTLYAKYNSFFKIVDGVIGINIFKLNNQKFALIIDSITHVYKFEGNSFINILNVKIGLGISSELKIKKIYLNSDNYEDFMLIMPTGGSAGDYYLCFFYDPELETLKYDNNTELRNVEFIKRNQINCSYNWSSSMYVIEKYFFRKIETTYYLIYSGKEKLENKAVVTKYDKNGNIIKIDTIDIK